jgi:hypothetical protein
MPARADSPPATRKPEPSKKGEFSKYMRIQRDKSDKPLALETAVVRFTPQAGDQGVAVDLIAAVHVGDAVYYRALNKLMEEYDVLLYELVAPEGTRIPKGGKRTPDNPLALIQQVLKNVLGLELQTELIDYSRKNFVHADLSPDKMMETIRNRGDNGFTLALSIAADFLRKYNLEERNPDKASPKKQEEDLDLLSLLFDPEGSLKLKRLLAEQFEMAGGDAGLGPTLNTILISDRNQAAMKVFQKELAGGKKKIGIFYGAAHMPDFEKRLRTDFGLTKKEERWLKAWDLSKKPEGSIPGLLKLFQ